MGRTLYENSRLDTAMKLTLFVTSGQKSQVPGQQQEADERKSWGCAAEVPRKR